jgi:hypothetical protein
LPSGFAPAAPGGKTRGDPSEYGGEKVTAAIQSHKIFFVG